MRDATVNSLLESIHSDHLDVNLFTNHFKNANDCKERMQTNEKKVASEIGFHKCALQTHVEHLTGAVVHYKQDVIKVLEEHVCLASRESVFTFRPVHDSLLHLSWQTHSMCSILLKSLHISTTVHYEIYQPRRVLE